MPPGVEEFSNYMGHLFLPFASGGISMDSIFDVGILSTSCFLKRGPKTFSNDSVCRIALDFAVTVN